MNGEQQGGGINPEALAADQAQELIKKLLARNQALEQQLQQTSKHDGNPHPQPPPNDVKPDETPQPQAHEPQAADNRGAEPSAADHSEQGPGDKDDGAPADHHPAGDNHAGADAHDEDETKARTCVDCDKTFPTLKALNRCSTCYQRLYKRYGDDGSGETMMVVLKHSCKDDTSGYIRASAFSQQ